MKIEIDYIKDANDSEKERVVFKVNKPTNLGGYFIAESLQVGENAIY